MITKEFKIDSSKCFWLIYSKEPAFKGQQFTNSVNCKIKTQLQKNAFCNGAVNLVMVQ